MAGQLLYAGLNPRCRVEEGVLPGSCPGMHGSAVSMHGCREAFGRAP